MKFNWIQMMPMPVGIATITILLVTIPLSATDANNKKDLKNLEFHLLNTGHFALEEEGSTISRFIREFMAENQIH